MDPLSALSIAAAVIQFVDFGTRILSTGWEIYKDGPGSGPGGELISSIAQDLERFMSGVKTGSAASTAIPHDQVMDAELRAVYGELQRLCRQSEDIGNQIKSLLPQTDKYIQEAILIERKRANEQGKANGNAFKAQERDLTISLFGVALEQVWNRRKIEEVKGRLSEIRSKIQGQMVLSILLETRGTQSWQHIFLTRIEAMDSRLKEALDSARATGPSVKPGDDNDTPADDIPEPSTSQKLIAELVDRIWQKDWTQDDLVVASQSAGVRERINSKVISWLKYETMQHREDAIANSFQATYAWVYDPSQTSFLPWLKSNSPDDANKPFWITGKPGSGKSTMMKYIVRHNETRTALGDWAGQLPLSIIRYYAWKPGTQMLAKSVDGLVRSILYQALRDNPDWAPQLCPRRWSFICLASVHSLNVSCPEWSEWELEECLQAFLKLVQNKMRLAVFIDGLDEFNDEGEESNDFHRLCELIQRLATTDDIKVCVASRPWRQFKDTFATSQNLEMHFLTRRDMVAFVKGQFEILPAFTELGLAAAVSQGFFLDIVNRAEGIFLWLTLVVKIMTQELRDGATLRDLRVVLDKMPEEIEKLYDEIFNRIPSKIRPHTAAMLRIVKCSHEREWVPIWLADEMRSPGAGADLSPDTLRPNLPVYRINMHRKLIARTRGLLDIVNKTLDDLAKQTIPFTGTVDFLHRTTAEWLERPDVLERLEQHSAPSLDPYKCLFQAHALMAHKDFNPRADELPGYDKLDSLRYACFYATRLDYRSDASLAKTVDESFYGPNGLLKLRISEKDFMDMCWEYSLMHYIHYKTENSHGDSAWPGGEMKRIFYVIFKPTNTIREDWPIRLELVSCLLANGFGLDKTELHMIQEAVKDPNHILNNQLPRGFIKGLGALLGPPRSGVRASIRAAFSGWRGKS